MASETIYKAIGYIEDEFVMEALVKKSNVLKNSLSIIAVLAASLLLYISMNGPVDPGQVYVFNDLMVISGKEVPYDTSDKIIKSLDLKQINEYLSPLKLKETYLEDMTIQMINGNLVSNDSEVLLYDLFTLDYQGQGGKGISVTTSRLGDYQKRLFDKGDGNKVTMINDVALKLAIINNTSGEDLVYYGEFELAGVYVTLESRGMGQETFIDFINNLLN